MNRIIRNIFLFLLSLSLLLAAGCSSPTKTSFNKIPEKDKNKDSGESIKISTGLDGVWEDPETKDLHTIIKTKGIYKVISVINYGSNKESAEHEIVKSSQWQNGVLKWSYYVPSTKYTVYFKTLNLDNNKLKIEWSNDDGAGNKLKGTETLNRMMDTVSTNTEDSATAQKKDLSKRLIGKIYKINGSEFIVAVSSPGKTLHMGDTLFVMADDREIKLEVVFPMLTISKCKVRKSSAKLSNRIRVNMPVYK